MFRKQHFFILSNAALLVAFFFIPALAQSNEVSKVELGAQFTLIHLLDSELTIAAPTNSQSGIYRRFYQTNTGFGGRLAYNLTRQIALEGEINYFPQTANRFEGKGLEGLFGKGGVAG